MTKEMIVTLSERLDRLGLGTDNGDAVHKLGSMQTDAILVSVISTSLYLISTESFPVPWNELKANSRMYLTVSRMWEATRIQRLCLNPPGKTQNVK